MAMFALLVLATGAVPAAPRQQTVVDICSRTAVVQTRILSQVNGATCSTITDTQLAGIAVLSLHSYSSPTLLSSDFTGLTGLRLLDVTNSPMLTTVPANALSGLTNLRDLDLDNNAITSLHEDSFNGLTNLEDLNLRYNAITSLDEDIFDGLTNLEDLWLDYNAITSLDEDIFDGLTNLNWINLGYNAITSLDEDIFDGLTNLGRIDFGDNAITSLDEDIFDGLTSLGTIYFNDNAITSLDEDIFDGLTNLGRIFFNDNAITSLDEDIFDGHDLFNIDLAVNAITSLDEDIFDGLSSLHTLDVSSNSISSLPVDLFDPLDDSLETLHLSGNSFTDLPDGIFDGLTGIKRLHLSCTSLTELNLDRFAPFAGVLTNLDIRRNDFTTPSDIRSILYRLRSSHFFEGRSGPWCRSDPLDVTVYFDRQAYYVEGHESAKVRSTLLGVVPISGAVQVWLSAAPGPGRSVTIPLTKSNQGGASDADYTSVPASLTFANHVDRRFFVLGGVDDTDDDDGESVQLGFGTLPAGVTAGTPSTSTVYLHDDDGPSVVTDGAYAELHEERFRRSVGFYLSSKPTADVTVTPSIASGTGFNISPAAFTFTPTTWNSLQYTYIDAPHDDDALDNRGVLSHTVVSADSDYNGAYIPPVAVTVFDNDRPEVTASFGAATHTVAEGNSVSVTVTLSAEPTRNVTIPLTMTNQGGASDVDYSGVPADVTFGATERSKTFTFAATQDTVDDDGESVLLGFGTLPAGVSAGSTATSTVSITDNDDPAVKVSATSLRIPEGGTGTYTVALAMQPPGDVTVTVVDPVDNTDVTAEPDSLTFTTSDWGMPQTVTVSAVQDMDDVDDTATVTHTVSGYGPVTTAASVTVMVDEDPTARYDLNGNGAIEKNEVIVALNDYLFERVIDKRLMVLVLNRYLSGG